MQVANGDCPHTLFYGPPGAGKKTLIIALLREIFGPSVEKARRPPSASAAAALSSSLPVLSACIGAQVRVETRPWKIALPSSNIEVELTTVSSNYHVEMNPSDVGNRDRHIVQEVIKARAPGGRILLSGPAARPATQRRPPSDARRACGCAGDVQKPAARAARAARLQGADPERGGPPDQGGAAQPAAHHGEVLCHLPPHLRLLQRVQGAGPRCNTDLCWPGQLAVGGLAAQSPAAPKKPSAAGYCLPVPAHLHARARRAACGPAGELALARR